MTAKSAALMRELEDPQEEVKLESGYLIKKQLQLEEVRVELCTRLEGLDQKLGGSDRQRTREEIEKIKQDLELYREFGDRLQHCSLDAELKRLVVRCVFISL